MSVVLCYVDKNRAIMASDGRVIDDNGNIVDENYQKFYRATKDTIIGYAGDLNACKTVVDLLYKNKDFVQTLPFKSIFNFIVDYCKTFPNDVFYGFMLCGIDSGKMIYGQIAAKSEPVIKYITNTDIVCTGLYPAEVQKSGDLFAKFLSLSIRNGDIPEKAINETIIYCSHQSHSVNSRIFLDKIQIHG